MYQGAPHNVIAQPWWSNNSNSMSMANGNNSNTVYSMDFRASFSLEYNVGSHIAEDFFLEDLSEFSNEDIAAPINLILQGNSSSSLQHSDDNTSSKDPASLVKSCDTSSSDSLLLQGAAALDYRSAQQQASMKDSCFPPPSQDETGFDWLSSFGEDSLIYGASNFGMESFLLNNADPFGDSYDGLMKQGQGDNSNVQDMKSGQGSGASDNDGGGGDNVDGRRDKSHTMSSHAMIMPHANNTHVTGRARSKRARSAGWSSSSILSSWSNSSPTNSLDSTSNLAHIPKPHSSSFLPCKQEEDHHEHLDYHPHDMELSSPNSKELNEDHNSDLSNISKLSSDQQAFNGWINKEDYREGSVNINGGLQSRRCTHCLSQKTPQWRAGPEGPKTLCNACGVRFKSGRLFDEYRPAKSPTFLSFKHSNSHKKVMEMRRRKGASDHHYANHRPKHTDDQLIRLKVKLNPKLVEAQYHFADVTRINTQSTRAAAIDSSPGFLYKSSFNRS